MARDHLSEMPRGESHKAQTDHDRRMNLFNRGLDVSGPPELNTAPSVLTRGLEIAQIKLCDRQSAVSPYHKRRVVLLPRKCIYVLGKLQRRRQLVGLGAVPPPTYQRRIKKQGSIKRVAQRPRVFVTSSRFRCSESSRG